MVSVSATILIVENHNALRQSLCKWLETAFPTCRLIAAANELEAIALAQTNSPQVIIMDVGLSGRNGFESLKRLKAIALAIPIIILTSYIDEAHQADAAANGASAYVWKDTMLTELGPALIALLSPCNEALQLLL